jgi:N-acyl-D-aspartate/D-glutamate deacylase
MVMGEYDVLRKATAAEIDKMKLLLNDDLQKGSLGLSTGLEYEQAFYSSKEEVIDLAKIAAMNHTRYMSHIRSEDVTIDDAMDEIISIGRITKMPVQISHLKIGIKDKWNTAELILKKLEAARAEGINITADVYPYNFWNSTLRVLFAKRDYENLASAQFAVDQVFDADESYLVQFAPEPSYKGKTISVIAKERNESPAKTIIELIKLASAFKKANPNYEGTVEAIAAKGMNEKDVANFIAWTHSNICSDGKDGGHPRGYGSFTKVLSKYTREDKLLFLEEAIHKMTGLTAAHLGIENRGTIQEGNIADLVLFDPNTVKDNSTIQDSKALSNGIQMVWVNGQLIYQKKKATGKLPGTLITSKN